MHQVVVEGGEGGGEGLTGDHDGELALDDRNEEFEDAVDFLVEAVDGDAVVDLLRRPL